MPQDAPSLCSAKIHTRPLTFDLNFNGINSRDTKKQNKKTPLNKPRVEAEKGRAAGVGGNILREIDAGEDNASHQREGESPPLSPETRQQGVTQSETRQKQ